jgi:hypothetical protein
MADSSTVPLDYPWSKGPAGRQGFSLRHGAIMTLWGSASARSTVGFRDGDLRSTSLMPAAVRSHAGVAAFAAVPLPYVRSVERGPAPRRSQSHLSVRNSIILGDVRATGTAANAT